MLEAILRDEASHFPLKRTANFALTLALLFLTSMCLGTKYQTERLVEPVYGCLMALTFLLYSIISTIRNAKELKRIHEIK